MNEKETHYGKFLKKEILKIDYSNDKKKATVFLKVKYWKTSTLEQIIFIKDFEKDNFNVIEYTVRQNR